MTIRTTLIQNKLANSCAVLALFKDADSPMYIAVGTKKDLYVSAYYRAEEFFTDLQVADISYRGGGFMMLQTNTAEVSRNLAWHRNIHKIFDDYDELNGQNDASAWKKWHRKL